MNETNTLHGSCHCGQLTVDFTTRLAPANLAPRACDCSFCQKHGAAYLSDPAGTLIIATSTTDAIREYRQGSESARFLLCNACGVLIAVVFVHEARIYGAVNAGCLDGDYGIAPAVVASPQKLSAEEKQARWLTLWIPDVIVPTSVRITAKTPHSN